jgi:hypothetical protein
LIWRIESIGSKKIQEDDGEKRPLTLIWGWRREDYSKGVYLRGQPPNPFFTSLQGDEEGEGTGSNKPAEIMSG